MSPFVNCDVEENLTLVLDRAELAARVVGDVRAGVPGAVEVGRRMELELRAELARLRVGGFRHDCLAHIANALAEALP